MTFTNTRRWSNFWKGLSKCFRKLLDTQCQEKSSPSDYWHREETKRRNNARWRGIMRVCSKVSSKRECFNARSLRWVEDRHPHTKRTAHACAHSQQMSLVSSVDWAPWKRFICCNHLSLAGHGDQRCINKTASAEQKDQRLTSVSRPFFLVLKQKFLFPFITNSLGLPTSPQDWTYSKWKGRRVAFCLLSSCFLSPRSSPPLSRSPRQVRLPSLPRLLLLLL